MARDQLFPFVWIKKGSEWERSALLGLEMVRTDWAGRVVDTDRVIPLLLFAEVPQEAAFSYLAEVPQVIVALLVTCIFWVEIRMQWIKKDDSMGPCTFKPHNPTPPPLIERFCQVAAAQPALPLEDRRLITNNSPIESLA